MDIKVKSNGNVEIKQAYGGLTIITNEGRRLNVILRDFGWGMNIEELNSKDDEKIIWHTVGGDSDFVKKDKPKMMESESGGIANCSEYDKPY